VEHNTKKTFLLRRLVIGAIILSFAYISSIFIYQYAEYNKVKERISAAYALTQNQSTTLYSLFSTFSEADNLFRLYTVDFDKKTFTSYKEKLDTIRIYIDSLSALPIDENPLINSLSAMQEKDSVANEFALLKKSVSDLVFLANDSLTMLERTQHYSPKPITKQSADSVINNILRDTLFSHVDQDTIVRKKQSLFKRIFNAKNDTLVAASTIQNYNTSQIDLIHKNIEMLISRQEQAHNRDLNLLQSRYRNLQQKERQLIQSNYRLLDNLKIGIDNLKSIDRDNISKAEQAAIIMHQENAHKFGQQLIIALSIMLFMILFILYYQRNAISYEKKLQEEKAYASLVAEEKTSVLANVSHEVRSPINSLLGIIEILKDKGDKHIIDPEILDSTAHEIAVINSTVNDILNLGKLEVGSLEIKNEFFSPYILLKDIIDLHAYQAKKKNLILTHEINIPSDFQMGSSIFRIRQIVTNLVSNAIKYTNEGTVKLQADIVSQNGSNQLRISVTDSGIGIAEEHQKNIFRQYYMADSKTKTGGFGLGLYISKLLAEQLNGDIILKSKPNEGSTFILTLPIQESSSTPMESTTYTLADLPEELNIVLIDDNRINILYLNHLFKDISQVRSFDNAADALDFIAINPVNIVITDLLMPEVNGWDVLTHIKGNPATQDIQVYVFTSDALLLDTQEAKQQPYSFDAVLSKPINEHQLVSKVLKNG